MRKVAALFLAAVLCLSLCACGENTPPPVDEAPEQTVTTAPLETARRFDLAYDPNASLHPITGTSPVNRMLTSLVYEGLYEPDENFVFHPVLAGDASVDETNLIWTITPAEGVTFSDGTPLEAGHIVSSLNAARKTTLYGSRLSGIISVRASKSTVIITLSEPNGALPSLLDVPIVLEQDGKTAPLGTGRYRYARNKQDEPYLVTRRSELPYPIIRLFPVSGSDERISGFDSGAVSMVTTDYFSPYALNYASTYEAWDYSTTDLLYVGFRTVDGPCQSELIRRAFSNAFDRTGIIHDLLDGHGDAVSLPIPEGHTEWDEGASGLLEYNMESAARLLQEAGYTLKDDGLLYRGKTPLEITLLVNSDNTAKAAVAERLAQSLGSLGVTVRVNGLPWADYTKALAQGNFDLYLAEVRLTGDFDVTGLLSGNLNYGGYDSAPIAERLAAWRVSTGETRTWMAKFFWLVFAEETPFAPLCFAHEALLVHWNSISNLTPTRNDPFYSMENWKLH